MAAQYTSTGSDTYPVGHIIHMVTKCVESNSHVTLAADNALTTLDGIFTLAITPKLASSTLAMYCQIHPYGGTNLTFAYDIYDSRTSAFLGNVTSDWGLTGFGKTTSYGANGCMVCASCSAGTTAARTYSLAMKSGSGSTLYNHSGGQFTFTIYEIRA